MGQNLVGRLNPAVAFDTAQCSLERNYSLNSSWLRRIDFSQHGNGMAAGGSSRMVYRYLGAAAFLLVALVAAQLVSLVPALRRASRQARIVANIHALDGKVKYDFEVKKPSATRGLAQRWLGDDLFGAVVEVDLSQTTASDATVELLQELPSMTRLALYRTPITDEALRRIGRMRQLEFLFLDRTAITDVGVRHLTGLQNLKQLIIQYTRITDEGMAYIGQLRNLQELALAETDVTDAGIGKLTGLKLESIKLDGTDITDNVASTLGGFTQLTKLDLFNTKITDRTLEVAPGWIKLRFLRIHDTALTDDCIENLATLKSLQIISLHNTQITDEGAEKLQKALPQCKICGKGL